jgi:hypothetical protein
MGPVAPLKEPRSGAEPVGGTEGVIDAVEKAR